MIKLTGPLWDESSVEPGSSGASVAYNSATAEPIGAFRNASPGELDAAVRKAAKAFESWGSTTPAERWAPLLRLADRLEGDGERFARLETTNVGESLGYAREELSFGAVWVNPHLVLANEVPFGAFGQSGYGKELSAHAIDEYSQLKHVMMKAVGS